MTRLRFEPGFSRKQVQDVVATFNHPVQCVCNLPVFGKRNEKRITLNLQVIKT
jgi:hypothetical protein